MDIVEQLQFDAVRCEATFSKGVATNIEEAAAEIKHLRSEFASMRARLVADRNEVQAGGEFNASAIQAYINDIDAALGQSTPEK